LSPCSWLIIANFYRSFYDVSRSHHTASRLDVDSESAPAVRRRAREGARENASRGTGLSARAVRAETASAIEYGAAVGVDLRRGGNTHPEGAAERAEARRRISGRAGALGRCRRRLREGSLGRHRGANERQRRGFSRYRELPDRAEGNRRVA